MRPIPAPAAIANAVEDALRLFRARVNRAPVTPARIVEAIYGDDRNPPKGP
jgi:carbon-monoxide dehydrogenase large subunit